VLATDTTSIMVSPFQKQSEGRVGTEPEFELAGLGCIRMSMQTLSDL
jgi:hypothetical protein